MGTPPDPARGAWDRHLREHAFGLGRLVDLARRETGIERHAVAITQEVYLGAEAAHGAAEGNVGGFLRPIRPGGFPRAPRDTVGPHDGAIEGPLVPIDGALRIQFSLERLENALPGAVAAPSGIAVVDRFPVAVAFGDIRPRGATMQPPEDAVEDRAVRKPGMARLPIGSCGQFVPVHRASVSIMVNPSVYHNRDRIVRKSLTTVSPHSVCRMRAAIALPPPA